METFLIIITWIGYMFAFIGFFSTIYKSLQTYLSLHSFTWRDFDKYSKLLIKKIHNDRFYPDIIVTIGRGGSILGSVISGNLCKDESLTERINNIPVLGCDRVYEWNEGKRSEIPNRAVDFSSLKNKKVLLVAGDILTGGTMMCFYNQLCEVLPQTIKTACLIKGITTTFLPDYYGKEIPGDFKMPWMYKECAYTRDSRKPILSRRRIHF